MTDVYFVAVKYNMHRSIHCRLSELNVNLLSTHFFKDWTLF